MNQLKCKLLNYKLMNRVEIKTKLFADLCWYHIRAVGLVTVLLEFPFTVVEWTDLASLQPTWDTVEMESVLKRWRLRLELVERFRFKETYVADTPSDCALLAGSAGLVCLAFDAKIHDVIAADCAVVYDDVWRKKMRLTSELSCRFFLEDPDRWTLSGLWVTESFLKFYSPQAHKATAFHCKQTKRIRSANIYKQRTLSLRYLTNSRKWNVIEISRKQRILFSIFLPFWLRIASCLLWLRLRRKVPDPFLHRRYPFWLLIKQET